MLSLQCVGIGLSSVPSDVNHSISGYPMQAMLWGREREEEAVKAYEKLQHVKTQRAGFFVDPQCCWLGASPDRLVGDDGILEVKCPFSARDSDVKLMLQKGNKCYPHVVDGLMHLKRSSDYYFQVLGQFAISKRKWCDFVVWTPLDIFVERITLDEQLWERCLVNLTEFYFTYMLPCFT